MLYMFIKTIKILNNNSYFRNLKIVRVSSFVGRYVFWFWCRHNRIRHVSRL